MRVGICFEMFSAARHNTSILLPFLVLDTSWMRILLCCNITNTETVQYNISTYLIGRRQRKSVICYWFKSELPYIVKKDYKWYYRPFQFCHDGQGHCLLWQHLCLMMSGRHIVSLQELCSALQAKEELYQRLMDKGQQLLTMTPEGPDSTTEQDLANLKEKWVSVQAKAAERKVTDFTERESSQRRNCFGCGSGLKNPWLIIIISLIYLNTL